MRSGGLDAMILCLLCAGAVVGEGLIELNSTTFSQALQNATQSNSALLVLFVRANCSECDALQHKMLKAYWLLHADPDYKHQMAVVDGSLKTNVELLKKHKIVSFPSLLLFGRLSKYEARPYKGEMTAEAFASAIRILTGFPAIRIGSMRDFFLRVNVLMEGFVVGMFESQSALYRKFLNLSEEMKIVRFYYTLNEPTTNDTINANTTSNSESNDPAKNGTVLIVRNPFFNQNETGSQLVYYNETYHGGLDLFVLRHFTSRVEICTQQTITFYRALKLPYMAFFTEVYENMNQTRDIAQQMLLLSLNYLGKVRFCLANIERGGIVQDLIGESAGEVAIFDHNGSIFQGSQMLVSRPDGRVHVKKKRLNSWLQQYLAGNLTQTDFKAKLRDLSKNRKGAPAARDATNTTQQRKDSRPEKPHIDLQALTAHLQTLSI